MAKRIDGERIVYKDPFTTIVPYLMPNRTEAEVSLTEKFDCTKLNKFITKYNNKNKKANLKFFHCFCYSLAKTIYHRPKMNIFIKGKYHWQRKDISLSFVAKQSFEDHAEEKLLFVTAKPEMTVKDISKIIVGDVKSARETGTNDVDKLMRTITSLPRFLVTLIFTGAKVLDFFGILPYALMKGDPNFSTVLISNLGSIGAGAPYHHLSNYGTNSIMVTIGTIEKVGKKDMVDITFTIDERIADGFYFAKSLRFIKYVFDHPEMLESEIRAAFPEGIA